MCSVSPKAPDIAARNHSRSTDNTATLRPHCDVIKCLALGPSAQLLEEAVDVAENPDL